MKFLNIFFLVFPLILISQETTINTKSEIICKNIDEFTDEISIDSGSIIWYEDGGDLNSQGMIVIPSLRYNNGVISFSSLILTVYGMKGCVDEGSTLDVIFENGKKTRLVNWNDFDCKGTNYFKVTENQLSVFKSSNISAVKYTNTRSYETMISKNSFGTKEGVFIKNVFNEIDKINDNQIAISTCDN
jgi:hypothetical protein